jgi:hypothetical protein
VITAMAAAPASANRIEPEWATTARPVRLPRPRREQQV